MLGALKRVSSSTHDRLITALARKYEEEGYYVKADHVGHPNGCPPEVNGYIPDVAAYAGFPPRLTIIAEAEKNHGCLSLATRFRLAQKTFAYTSEYDTAIAAYLGSCTHERVRSSYPEVLP